MTSLTSIVAACSLAISLGCSGGFQVQDQPTQFSYYKPYSQIYRSVCSQPSTQTNNNCNSSPICTQQPTQTANPAPTATPSTPTPTPSQTTSPKPTQTPSTSTSMDAYAKEVVRQVNVERAKQGLAPVSADEKATQAAYIRAEEIVSTFSHTRPDGSSCFTALKQVGASYRGAGENIAKGQTSVDRVMAGWMSSPGHYANIMKESFTKIGVAHIEKNGIHYWVQLFMS